MELKQIIHETQNLTKVIVQQDAKLFTAIQALKAITSPSVTEGRIFCDTLGNDKIGLSKETIKATNDLIVLLEKSLVGSDYDMRNYIERKLQEK